MEVFKLVSLGDGDESPEVSGEAGDLEEDQAAGDNRGGFLILPQKVGQWANHLRCLYMKVRSLGNKQEELEVLAQSQNYVIGITETGWDSSHDWSTVMDGNKLFRKNR